MKHMRLLTVIGVLTLLFVVLVVFEILSREFIVINLRTESGFPGFTAVVKNNGHYTQYGRNAGFSILTGEKITYESSEIQVDRKLSNEEFLNLKKALTDLRTSTSSSVVMSTNMASLEIKIGRELLYYSSGEQNDALMRFYNLITGIQAHEQ